MASAVSIHPAVDNGVKAGAADFAGGAARVHAYAGALCRPGQAQRVVEGMKVAALGHSKQH